MSKRKRVKRFSKPVIIAHWLNALAYFLLLFTGSALFTDSFNWVYDLFGGPANARLIHRISGICIILPVIIVLIMDRTTMAHWLKNAVTWEKRDLEFFVHFPKELLGGHAKGMPKQDFYNSGEKLNSLLTVLSVALLFISGMIMWLSGSLNPTLMAIGDAIPRGIVQWSFLLHDIGFIFGGTVVVGHVFLSVGHPGSKIALEGMTKGDVPIEYAKDHHELWFEELKEKGEITPEDERNMKKFKKRA